MESFLRSRILAVAMVLAALITAGVVLVVTRVASGDSTTEELAGLRGEKLELYVEQETRIAAARLSPIPTSGNPQMLLTPIEAEAWPTGVIDQVNSSSEFLFANVAQFEVDGGFVQVFAGESRYLHGRGVVVVRRLVHGSPNGRDELYFASEDSGRLRVTMFTESIVSFSSELGATFSLDLSEHILRDADGAHVSSNSRATPYIPLLGQETARQTPAFVETPAATSIATPVAP